MDFSAYSQPRIGTQTARCLKKVTSITRSIKILLAYANDLYLRSRFFRGKWLEFECVPNRQYNLKLPPTPEDYKSIAGLALISQGPYWNNGRKPGNHIMQHYHINLNSAPVLPAPVHCERVLISYLLKEGISPPPFSYIGISEISCFFYPETMGALLPHQTKKV